MVELKKINIFRRLIIFYILILIMAFGACTIPSPEASHPRVIPRVTLSPLFNPRVYPRLAVFIIDNTRKFRKGGALRQVEDEFMRAAIEKGYILAARSDINNIKKELDLQRSRLTEKEIAEIGHFLNVPAVVIASINNVSTERYYPTIRARGARYYSTSVSVNISARMISTELAEVLWLSSYTGSYVIDGRGREQESLVLAPVAKIVASGLPDRHSSF